MITIKKLNFKFVLMLLLELLVVGGIVNVIFYNNLFREFVINNVYMEGDFLPETSMLKIYLFLFILFAIPGIFNYIFMKLFQIISRKDMNLDETDEESVNKVKRMKKIYTIINIVSNIILVIVLFLSANKFSSDLTKILQESSIDIEQTMNVTLYLGLPNMFKYALLYSTLPMMLIAIVPFKKLFNKKAKRFINPLIYVFALLGLAICTYSYVDIPEFKYRYSVSEDKVYVDEYVDNRDIIYSEKFTYPKKIWNKDVTLETYSFNFGYLPNVNGKLRAYEITSQQTFEEMAKADYIYGNEIYSTVEQDDWIIDNNIIYNNAKDVAIVCAQSNHEARVIPKSVKQMKTFSFFMSYDKFWSNTSFDEENELAFIEDKVIYEKEVSHDLVEDFSVVSPKIEEEQIIFVPAGVKEANIKYDGKKEYVLILSVDKIDKLIISKEFGENVKLINVAGLHSESEIIVDEDNEFLIYENNEIRRKDTGEVIFKKTV